MQRPNYRRPFSFAADFLQGLPMSAVTAVPLRPLAKGSVLKLWIVLALMALAAAGLGWWGTRWMQEVTLESGARYRVVDPGTGPAFASQSS